jgi:DNA-directed RNA polymerase subunit RPC12/RpoP
MKKILRKEKSTYALSLMLCFMGIVALLATLWITWPTVSSAENPFSAYSTLLWTEKLNLIPGLEFKLIYLVVLGDVMLISGVVIWALSREWFLLPEKIVWYQCTFCKKKWRASGDKALVRCPHCRQLVHPKMIKK